VPLQRHRGSDHAVGEKPPQGALADSDDRSTWSARSVIRHRGYAEPAVVAAYFRRQEPSGSSLRVVSGVHLVICQTELAAICSDDPASIRVENMQLRVTRPTWLPWVGAAQRQAAPADNH
jgi:hypothetical protein